MNAMYVSNSDEHLFVNNINMIHQKNNTIKYMKKDKKSEITGDIVQINNANIIEISDYFGSAFQSNNNSNKNNITSLDIINMSPNIIELSCKSAQSIGNRVIIEFEDGREVEINGNLIGGKMKI